MISTTVSDSRDVQTLLSDPGWIVISDSFRQYSRTFVDFAEGYGAGGVEHYFQSSRSLPDRDAREVSEVAALSCNKIVQQYRKKYRLFDILSSIDVSPVGRIIHRCRLRRVPYANNIGSYEARR